MKHIGNGLNTKLSSWQDNMFRVLKQMRDVHYALPRSKTNPCMRGAVLFSYKLVWLWLRVKALA